RYPLFPGAEMKWNKLNCIMEVNGVHRSTFSIRRLPRRRVFFRSTPKAIRDRSRIAKAKRRVSDGTLERRMTPEEAMQHPWISSERAWEARFRQPGDVTTRFSPTAGAPVVPPLRLRQSLQPAQTTSQTPQPLCGLQSLPVTTLVDIVKNRSSSSSSSKTNANGSPQRQPQRLQPQQLAQPQTAEPVNPTAASNAPVDEANVELDKDTAEDAAGDDV
uniref:Non-specific serine/threonine protein kinase n=1 Tax=Macrostomum lignano TaxID=282301 RepID=A0A1I8FBR9_9PLAT